MPVALVTGSALGIGRCIALRLAADGYDVALNDLERQSAVLEELSSEIKAANPGRRTALAFGDVSKEKDVEDVVKRAVDELGSLDVVSVYNT